MRRELSANKAQALLARICPADDVGRVRLNIARDHLADIRALDARLKFIAAQIAALVTASGTSLTGLYGIGPIIAGRILAEAGDVARFATKDKFASYNGTAPIDVSSGEQVRHRLSRAGNRRTGHALHMMAVTQIRYPGSEGRVYYEGKRQEGKTPKEALRCLKRRLSDLVYRQLAADRQGRIESCGSPTTPVPTPPAFTSPASRSRRAAPPSRRPHPPAPAGSPPWTGKTAGSPASRSPAPAPGSTATFSTRPRSSADPGPAPHPRAAQHRRTSTDG
jgi:Transposase IS116/IS110/IS902 family